MIFYSSLDKHNWYQIARDKFLMKYLDRYLSKSDLSSFFQQVIHSFYPLTDGSS